MTHVDIDDSSRRERIGDLLERRAADDAVAQRLDDLAALDDGPRLDAVHGAAVVLWMITSWATSTSTPGERMLGSWGVEWLLVWYRRMSGGVLV